MATYDDLLRLVNAAAGGPGATASDAVARGVPPAYGPPAPQAPLPLPVGPPVAQPPNVPVPELGDAVMGPAGPLERLAGNLPGNAIAGLLDLAGSLLRGHSAYADVRKRAALNDVPGVVAQKHYEDRTALEDANANRARLIASDRAARLQNRIDMADSRLADLSRLASTPGLDQGTLASYKNEAADLQAKRGEWSKALARVSGEQSLSLSPSPLSLPDVPIPINYGAIRAKSKAEAEGTAAGKPPDTESNPADYVMTDRVRPYMDISNVTIPKVKQKFIDYAMANKIPVADKKAKNGLELLDAARAGTSQTLQDAYSFLPERPLNGFAAARNWFNAATKRDPNLASWGTQRLKAIEQIQAAASLGTGLRLTQYEIKTAAENDLPTMFDWVGSARAKAEKLQGIYDDLEAAILGDPGAKDRLVATIKRDANTSNLARPNPNVSPGGTPEAARPSPTAPPGADPNFDPIKEGGVPVVPVRAHTRKVRPR